MRAKRILILLGVVSMCSPSFGQFNSPPEPPREVIEHDLRKEFTGMILPWTEILLDVEWFKWRHGCAPTAAGVLLWYYKPGWDWIADDYGQMIASGGDYDSINGVEDRRPPGQEKHFEDFASPVDFRVWLPDEERYCYTTPDDYLTANRLPHPNDCLADYMWTSRSEGRQCGAGDGRFYGWTCINMVIPGMEDYIKSRTSDYKIVVDEIMLPKHEGPDRFTQYHTLGLWPELMEEINDGMTMLAAVDTLGDGYPDHLVTIVGYRYHYGDHVPNPFIQYACLDTWSGSVRWEWYRGCRSYTNWGIDRQYTVRIVPSLQRFIAQWLHEDCGAENRWCDGADINNDGVVNLVDYVLVCSLS